MTRIVVYLFGAIDHWTLLRKPVECRTYAVTWDTLAPGETHHAKRWGQRCVDLGECESFHVVSGKLCTLADLSRPSRFVCSNKSILES